MWGGLYPRDCHHACCRNTQNMFISLRVIKCSLSTLIFVCCYNIQSSFWGSENRCHCFTYLRYLATELQHMPLTYGWQNWPLKVVEAMLLQVKKLVFHWGNFEKLTCWNAFDSELIYFSYNSFLPPKSFISTFKKIIFC